MLPRVFLNAWRSWQRVPVPFPAATLAASAGGRGRFFRATSSTPAPDERLERVAVAVTEMAHAAMGSRQWDYCALAADQLSELHAAEVALDDVPAADAAAHRAFIEATRALLFEFGRIP